MSSLLQNYESECQIAVEQAKALLLAARSEPVSSRSGLLKQVEQYYDDGIDLVDQMEIELNNSGASIDGGTRALYKSKIREYKKQLQAEVKAPLQQLVDENDREILLGGRSFDNEEQRQQLLSSHAVLQKSGDKLRDATRVATETEGIGAQIMMDLRSQRETLENARQTLFQADSYVDKSIRTLKTMSRRLVANKFISYAIIAVLILLILLVLFSKFK